MKQIPNYSRYVLDEQGNIYSTNYKNSGKTKILKPAFQKDGYLKTMILGDDGKYLSKSIHKLMALTYFGKHDGLQVNHKNGIKHDNRLCNLEIVTRGENIKHAYLNGLIIPKRGELNGNSKLTQNDVKEIREYVANFKGRYYGRKELAKKYGISEAHLKDIVNGRRGIWMDL
jgi:hypothetical protein